MKKRTITLSFTDNGEYQIEETGIVTTTITPGHVLNIIDRLVYGELGYQAVKITIEAEKI